MARQAVRDMQARLIRLGAGRSRQGIVLNLQRGIRTRVHISWQTTRIIGWRSLTSRVIKSVDPNLNLSNTKQETCLDVEKEGKLDSFDL